MDRMPMGTPQPDLEPEKQGRRLDRSEVRGGGWGVKCSSLVQVSGGRPVGLHSSEVRLYSSEGGRALELQCTAW